MEIIDYIFIICCIIGIFALLVLIIRPFFPKYLILESKETNIKKGKIIGSVMGVIIGIYFWYYFSITGYHDMFVAYLQSLL